MSKLAPVPAFAEKFSADMRAALFRTVLDVGMDVRAALRAAGAGELEHLGADDQRTLAGMAYGYACELVRDERDRRGNVQKVRADTTDAALQLAARLLALADREVARIERTKAKEPVDTARGLAAAKMAREALALARDAAPKQPTSKQPAAPAPRPTTLAAAIAAGESTAPNNAPSEASDSATPATTTTKENTHDTRNGAVALRAASSLRDASVTAV